MANIEPLSLTGQRNYETAKSSFSLQTGFTKSISALMIFATGTFFLFIALGLVAFWTTPVQWRSVVILPSLNLIFLYLFLSIQQMAYLLSFVVIGYIFILFLQKYPKTKVAFVGGILLLFLYFRQYPFMEFLGYPENFPFIIGLSYVFFRVIQLAIDIASRDIEKAPSISQYLNFSLNFMTVISGPIQRYQDFSGQIADLKNSTVTEEFSKHSLVRVIIGFLKAGPIAAILLTIHNIFLSEMNANIHSNSVVALGIFLFLTAAFYLVFLYYNFSGYTDIAIGFSRLFGLTPPENFNKPFAANNFIDLWQRWHMSLGNWMKLYVFNPTLTFLMRRVKNPKFATYMSAIAFFYTFMLLGYWHGTSELFLICGLMLGFGMAINKLYQVKMKDSFGKVRTKAIRENFFYQKLCFGLTFAWLSLSILGFWAEWSLAQKIVGVLGPLGLFGLLVFSTIVAALIRGFWDSIVKITPNFLKGPHHIDHPLLQYVFMAIGTLFLIFYFAFWSIGDLGFVYEGF